MKKHTGFVLHIPARAGSKRVPAKNLRIMNGQPMIRYAIDAALKSGVTDQCYVNTDSEEIIAYVTSSCPKMNIFLRAPELANDQASSDQFNYDIITKLKPNHLIMINPVCPLITAEDIRRAVEAYLASDCDTLISSSSTQMQVFCEGEPVNIALNEPLAPSQSNKRVTTLNWAVTIWDAQKFSERMEQFGYASLGENRLLFDIDPIHAVKVSEEKDFLFAEQLIRAMSRE